MADSKLLAQWKITENWLREAESRLIVTSELDNANLTKFEDYLSHNELELALYELVEAARESPQSHRFWDAMCQAAGSMSLDELRNAFAAEWASLRSV